MVQEYQDQYVELAGRTAAAPPPIRTEVYESAAKFLYDVNMLTEAGTNADLMKRSMFYNEPLTRTQERGRDATASIKSRYDTLQVLSLTDPEKIKLNDDQINLIHAAFGMFSEAGEIIEEVINSAIEARELDMVNINEELGDVSWYVALALRVTKASWIQVLKSNIAKLAKRYPDKFDSESALNRDLDGEREVLEKQSA